MKSLQMFLSYRNSHPKLLRLNMVSPILMKPSSVRWYFGVFSLPSVKASFSAWIFWKTNTSDDQRNVSSQRAKPAGFKMTTFTEL